MLCHCKCKSQDCIKFWCSVDAQEMYTSYFKLGKNIMLLVYVVVPLNHGVNISPRVFKTAMRVNKLEQSGYLPDTASCQTIEMMSQKL